MSSAAIRVDGIGKSYRLGYQPQRYRALRDTLTNAARLPGQILRTVLGRNRRVEDPGMFWALKGVSFEIEQGDIVGILGRNGAGKSTLLKILSRITDPTCGRAEIFGRVGSLLEVGSGFHPELSGRENVFMNGAILGMRRDEIVSKFDEIVAFAEVERFVDTAVKHYSSGMYLRLAFAVAAHLETEILFVDEVLAVGDAAFQKKCLGKMGDVARSGRTVLFVSHNLAAVENLCTKAILLEGGKVAAEGDTKTVITDYVSGISSNDSMRMLSERKSSGKPLSFTAVEVRSGNGGGGNVARVGESFTIRLHYKALERVSEPVFGISIHTRLDIALFGVFSNDLGCNIEEIEGEGWVDFHVDSPNLMPDTYMIHIAAGDSFDIHRYDYVPQAALMDVVPGDIYGSGRLTGASWSHVFFGCRMELSGGAGDSTCLESPVLQTTTIP